MKFRVMVIAVGTKEGSVWKGTFKDFRYTSPSYILLFDECRITYFICVFF